MYFSDMSRYIYRRKDFVFNRQLSRYRSLTYTDTSTPSSLTGRGRQTGGDKGTGSPSGLVVWKSPHIPPESPSGESIPRFVPRPWREDKCDYREEVINKGPFLVHTGSNFLINNLIVKGLSHYVVLNETPGNKFFMIKSVRVWGRVECFRLNNPSMGPYVYKINNIITS